MASSKKKATILSKINFRSPKTRGLLILALFAVIGGGLMVYRSFADSVIATYPASTYYGVSGTVLSELDTTIAGKSPAPILKMASGSAVTRGGTIVGTVNKGQSYKYCARIKGIGRIKIGNNIGPDDIGVIDSKNYRTYCRPVETFNGNGVLAPAPAIVYNKYSVGYLYFDGVTVQLVNNPGTPAPGK